MVKLIAVYTKPDDTAAFDKHYNEVHTPLVRRMPGLQKLEVSRCYGAPMGDPRYYLLAEMYFDSRDALIAALKSDAGKAAGKDLMGFAAKYVHMMFAEVN
ncbi:MAG: hypothetical protein HJJLKODD_00535 [Phycisphaerae bacterium]|nr:hypothetical protein [Phycisphaerae bacterium]